MPRVQIAAVASSWVSPAVTVTVFASAALPSLLLSVCAFGMARHWWRNSKRRLVPPAGGGQRPLERGVTDNHGHAAFATPAEIAARFGQPGCLIGAMDRGERPQFINDDTDTGPGHSFVFAGPGRHKTTSAINRIFNWNGPRVVFDPSCEIGPIMTEALEAKCCNVVSIGLTGQGINALDWIDTTHPESDAHIRTVVDHIYNEGAASRKSGALGKDPFWSNWGVRWSPVCWPACCTKRTLSGRGLWRRHGAASRRLKPT